MQDHIKFKKRNIYYQEELYYYYRRLLSLAALLSISIIFYYSFYHEILHDILLQSIFCLALLGIVSLVHYAMFHLYPDRFLIIRKIIPIILDISLLTYLLILFGEKGVFLLLFYILIVMHVGLNFGENYFYVSILFSSISWITVLYFSPYWQEYYHFLATFAVATFLIPFFYLDHITEIHDDRLTLNSTLESVSHQANLDPLTGAYNRKSYDEICQYLINEKTPFALFYIDLNRFKQINDTYGHEVGDKVLQEVTERFRTLLCDEDIIIRLGGDEFVIFLSRKFHSVQKFVHEVESNVIGTMSVNDISLYISLSMGISLYPEDGRDIKRLTSYADKAMYYAKKIGTHHCFYQDIKTISHP